MPTSVLLAVLAAASLLALAPALVRRYDAAERLEAERAHSTARVLSRTRRRRTVPGRRPINPSRVLVATLRVAAPAPDQLRDPSPGPSLPRSAPPAAAAAADRTTRAMSVAPRSAPPATRTDRPVRLERPARPDRPAHPARTTRTGRPRHSPAIYRRRRVLAALLLLNAVELIGVAAVGPGFWVGFAVTGTILLAFLVHLRNLALADQRRRRAERREQTWLAAQQAEVRREQDRRAAQRRAAARRMAGQRESLRRAGDGWSAPPTVSYRRARGG